MEYLTKEEELERRASPELLDLIEQCKDGVIKQMKLVEKIRMVGYREHFTDIDLWVLLKHSFQKMELSKELQKKFLTPFKPIKIPEGLPEDTQFMVRPAGSMETFEGNFEFFCPLNVIDEDVEVAKFKLKSMIDQLREGFYIQLKGYKFANIKEDARNHWLVPEGLVDATAVP